MSDGKRFYCNKRAKSFQIGFTYFDRLPEEIQDKILDAWYREILERLFKRPIKIGELLRRYKIKWRKWQRAKWKQLNPQPMQPLANWTLTLL